MTAQQEIVEVLVKYRHLVRTNTPLEVLADHMIASLQLFEHTLQERADHPFFAPGKRHAS